MSCYNLLYVYKKSLFFALWSPPSWIRYVLPLTQINSNDFEFWNEFEIPDRELIPVDFAIERSCQRLKWISTLDVGCGNNLGRDTQAVELSEAFGGDV